MRVDTYVSERRKKNKHRRKYFFTIVIFLVAYFVIFGIFILIVRSPAFQEKRITIVGNSAVSQTDILNLLQASILKSGAEINTSNSGFKAMLGFGNMLIWPNALPPATVAAIPQLAGVTISKDYFLHTITVTVTERQPFAVWCLDPTGNESCFWFDDHGTVFQKAFDTQGNAIMVIHDYAQSKLTIDTKILPDEFVDNFISIANVLKQSGLNIQEIALHSLSLQQIDVATVNGPALYFSLRFPADSDLSVIKDLLNKGGFNKLQYIDFTVENRAYYK